MTEKLLQFIWQFQYFNTNELTTTGGEPIRLIRPGEINHNQGPDFLNASLVIGNTTWAGNIELHVQSGDWKKHNHDRDKNYRNVILHVVWQDDEATPSCQLPIPVLELQQRIPKILLQRYEELMNASSFIPCGNSIHAVNDIIWVGWKDRLLAERLLRKATGVEQLFRQTNNHWEETFWCLLARNFGMKVNATAFEGIARSVRVSLLARHKNQIHQLESLLLGQASLLNENFEEDYPRLLQKEYKFLQKKYQLKQVPVPVLFLRMRPGNFPTIRLAQLAALVNRSAHLFSAIKEAGSIATIRERFCVTANDYWHYHYRFDEAAVFRKKNLGSLMIDNIIINSVVPVLFAYGSYQHENKYKVKALQWLEQTAAELNTITKGFKELGIENRNAYDSQALTELKNEYCQPKKCLECAIGNSMLKSLR